jgi:hypothetical protein
MAEVKQDLVAGAMATSSALALGANPVPATIIGASGPAMKLVGKLGGRAMRRRADRQGRVLDEAAQILDVGLDILEERVAGYDDRLELLARVMDAAGFTALPGKVTALARVLAGGLRPNGDVGVGLVLAAALSDIEAPHLVVLDHLSRHSGPALHPGRSVAHGPDGWNTAELGDEFPEYASIMDGLTSVLVGHGLLTGRATVMTVEGDGPFNLWSITQLGRRCLTLLGAASAEEAGPAR